MPAHDLMELLQRLHGEAERVLLESITERESREEDAATNELFPARLQRLRGTARRPRPEGGGLTIAPDGALSGGDAAWQLGEIFASELPDLGVIAIGELLA